MNNQKDQKKFRKLKGPGIKGVNTSPLPLQTKCPDNTHNFTLLHVIRGYISDYNNRKQVGDMGYL